MKKVLYVLFFNLAFFILVINAYADEIHISSFSDLQSNITSGETEFILDNDIICSATITVSNNIKINGNNHTLNRASDFKGNIFIINAAGILELDNLVIDGGASGWKMDIENRFYTSDTTSAYVRFPSILDDNDIEATSTMINNKGSLVINNSTIKNAYCTVTGCVIYGKGNNTINGSTFQHVCSSKNGGVMYVTGGETIITGSTFKDNVSGCGITSATQGGAIYITGASLLEIKDNTVFEENLAQNNSGAAYIVKTNTLIENSKFIRNRCGNDGSALTLSSSSTAGCSATVQNTEFDGNYGYATRGQSLGTIWMQKWLNDEEHPIVFKNLVFKNNTVGTGAAIADAGGDATYIQMDNIESYDNYYRNGGGFYFQGTITKANNINIHGNKCIYNGPEDVNTCRGAAFYMRSNSPLTISNMVVNNNEGSGVCVIAGKVEINNSTITNNSATHASGGGGVQIIGSENETMVDMTINNTVIANNTSKTYGGGISILDNEDVFSKIVVDDQSKIYDNKAEISGDDFSYIRKNDSANTSTNTITLSNISVAGITGIDGWYNDPENDRFATTNSPSQFNDYVGYNGSGVFLKAAGVSTVDFELEGGTNDNIETLTIKYGVETQISDDIPEKDGYVFTGWNTEAAGTGTSIQPGSTYDGKDGLMLYAQYAEDKNHNGIDDSTEKRYTVKFVEGDSGTLAGKILYENILTGLTFSEAGIEVPTIKANEGYISLGWDKEPTGKIESDLTFVALYQENLEVNETVIPVEENVPKTGDNIYTWFVTYIISLFGIISSAILLKKLMK